MPRLIAIIAIFGGGNVLLFYGQDLWHRDDKRELDTIKVQLSSLAAEAAELESELGDLDRTLDGRDRALLELQAEIHWYEAQLVAGRPQRGMYESYSDAVDLYNSEAEGFNLLLAQRAQAFELYETKIEEHNVLVPRANELARAVGTKWYIAPSLSAVRARPD